MIITQTPFRMSFFGGGTDMESFFPYLMGTFFNHLLFSSVSSGSIPHLDLL